jgi:hypothetical protein
VNIMVKGMMTALLIVSATAAPAASLRCEANLTAANKAADEAVQAYREQRKARAAAGTAIGCAIVTIGTGGLDLGLLSLLCAGLAAGVYAASDPQGSSELADQAFRKVRDPRCARR